MNNPGVDKLYIAARRRSLKVTKKEVKTLLSRLGERQIFQAIQPSKGKAAAEDIDARFQMDLIDLFAILDLAVKSIRATIAVN